MTSVLAHGLGGATDLPIPLSYALIGAACALTFTFVVVALAWRKPRFDADKPGRPLPQWFTDIVDAPATRWTVGIVGLLFAAWVAVAAVFGPQDSDNPLPGVFYVLMWVGLAAVSVAIGPVWRVLSPVRTVYRLTPLARRPAPLAYPVDLGYWPAALGLFALVWLELASADAGSLTAIRVWLLTYLVITLAGTVAYGTRWPANADPFEVYGVAVSRLSPMRRNADGRIAIGNPFDHLPSLPVRNGTVAVLAVLLGSTAFDSFSATQRFRVFAYEHADSVPFGEVGIRTHVLLSFVCIVGVTFWAAARATGGVSPEQRRALPGAMAHSLIPIVVGYVFAHYLTYLLERSQQAFYRLADPLGTGWLGYQEVNYFLSLHPSFLATLKVCFVVGGHIAGVIAAHDRALRVLPKRHRITGQLAMMLVMVGYTFAGLYLLFGG